MSTLTIEEAEGGDGAGEDRVGGGFNRWHGDHGEMGSVEAASELTISVQGRTLHAVAATAKKTASSAAKRRTPKSAKTSTPKPRVRRDPEEARALILDAATRLLAERGPADVGLVDVAREAGVSHALVTHYFKTIEGVVDAALEAHAERERQTLISMIVEQPNAEPRAWMEQWFRWINRPAAARILAWSFLSGRMARADFFARRMRGARRVVDAVLARAQEGTLPHAAKREDGSLPFSREDLEFVVLLLLSATHGYALGKIGYWPSLGVDEPKEPEDAFFFERLAALAERYLADARSRGVPA